MRKQHKNRKKRKSVRKQYNAVTVFIRINPEWPETGRPAGGQAGARQAGYRGGRAASCPGGPEARRRGTGYLALGDTPRGVGMNTNASR